MVGALKTILVTGGAGFVGSHTCVELLAAGFSVVAVDNRRVEALERVEQITHRDLMTVTEDIRDQEVLNRVFEDFPIDAVVHTAGLNSIPESVLKPRLYFDVNLGGTIALCDVMEKHGVRNIVFTSSAAVYGISSHDPITEFADTTPTNPLGKAKLSGEKHLRERCEDNRWNAVALRCFNPAGAHPSGLIGEHPKGDLGSLASCITQVAVGNRSKLVIHGDGNLTRDGTCVRDYIHVMDVARAHARALDLLEEKRGFTALNLGSGRAYSVKNVHAAFERAVGQPIPCEIGPKRESDLSVYFADAAQAEMELAWRAQYDIDDIARDAWNWQKNNPNGYVT